MKNDHKGCLRLLDALLQDIPHSRSCGLARVVVFSKRAAKSSVILG